MSTTDIEKFQGPLISVVIPAYNRAKEVRASIESVLRQTVTDLEVLIVDDASTDETAEVVEGVDDSRVSLVRLEKNLGGSGARNIGIRQARGVWVAFQDSDDEWLPRKLEKQLASIEKMGADTVGSYCGVLMVREPSHGGTGDRRHIVYHPKVADVAMEGMLYDSLLRAGSLISTQSFMARRNVLLQVGGFDEELKALQDWDLLLRFSRAGLISFVDEPLVIQRLSSNSLTWSKKNRVIAMRSILQKHREALESMPKRYAEYCHTIAGGFRNIGDFREAVSHEKRALSLSPKSIRIWLGLLYSIFLRLRQALEK